VLPRRLRAGVVDVAVLALPIRGHEFRILPAPDRTLFAVLPQKTQIGPVSMAFCGNERDAHSCAYHSEQAGKLTASKNHLRMDACAVARGDGIFAEQGHRGEGGKGSWRTSFNEIEPTPGQFVFLR